MRVHLNDPAWQRALLRAIDEELQVRRLSLPDYYEQGGMTSFMVEASVKNGSWYLVDVHENSVQVFAVCTCKAGQKQMACKHGAAALAHRGLLDSLVPRQEAA